MTNARRSAPLFALALVVSAGCGPSWVVVKQASPNPLAAKKSFAVDAVSWDGVMIGGKDTEATWIGKRKPEEQEKFKQSWDADKAESGQIFVSKLGERIAKLGAAVAPAAGGDAFAIKAHVNTYEPGSWNPTGFGTMNTMVVMTVDFVDGAGAVQDTVQFTSSVPGGITTPSSGQRVRIASEELARQVAAYLQGRTAVK